MRVKICKASFVNEWLREEVIDHGQDSAGRPAGLWHRLIPEPLLAAHRASKWALNGLTEMFPVSSLSNCLAHIFGEETAERMSGSQRIMRNPGAPHRSTRGATKLCIS